MGFIPSDIISQILDRCDIVETISSYVSLKHAGRNFKTTCPFHHEKTASFVVSPDKQIFHCFGCGVGGNVITFVMHQEHVEFPQAVVMLADKVGIKIPEQEAREDGTAKFKKQLMKVNELACDFFYNNLLSDKTAGSKYARKYLKERSVTLDMVKSYRIGFALDKWEELLDHLKKKNVSLSFIEKAGLIVSRSDGQGFYDRFRNRIIFPIFDIQNRCIAFGARTLEKDNPAKYINSPETLVYIKGKHLYGFNWAKEEVARRDFVIVVEGYMDFIVPFEAGVKNIVASLGTALTTNQIRRIRRYTKNVVMLFDTDKAGEMAVLRSLDVLIEEDMNVKVATLDKEHDPDSFVKKFGIKKFLECIVEADSLFEYKLKFLVNQHGIKTTEAKARISEEILPTINKAKNAIIRSEQIKRLSQILLISQDVLTKELRRISEGKSVSRLSSDYDQQNDQKKRSQIHPVERNLLRLMLEEREFVELARNEVDSSKFRNEFVRNIVNKIYELHDKGKQASLSAVMSFYEDEKVLQLLSSFMTQENVEGEDKQKVYYDCLNRMNQDSLKNRKKEIRRQMEVAINLKDQQKLERLTREFNQLVKG